MTAQVQKLTVNQTQLPFWPRQFRGLPNVFAQSALFGIGNIRSSVRPHLKRHPIATLNDVRLTYTGETLRLDDEDVFLQILHIARTQPLGTTVRFTANSIITELGWTRNKGSYKRLADSLDRMQASSLAVTFKDVNGLEKNFTGSLIRLFTWQQSSTGASMRQWEILLEPEIVALFSPEGYSTVDWNFRLKLPPMAKWLHTFIHASNSNIQVDVPTMHRLMGSETKSMPGFRNKLNAALKLLVQEEFLISSCIDSETDLVYAKRKHNPNLNAIENQPDVLLLQ